MDFEIGALFRALKKMAQGMHRCSIDACPANEATVKFANFSRRSQAQSAFWAVFRFRSFGPPPDPNRILWIGGGFLLNNGGRNRFQKIAIVLAFEQRGAQSISENRNCVCFSTTGGAIDFRKSQVSLFFNNGGRNQFQKIASVLAFEQRGAESPKLINNSGYYSGYGF